MTRPVASFRDDARYRRFLAAHAGLWGEVGALDDPLWLRRLRRDRRQLGLPFDCWVPPTRPAFRRQRNAR
jgi:hypothetical protein